MKIYFDDSVHDQYGFMLLAFVVCEKNPDSDIKSILESNGIVEFHACENMKNHKLMRDARSKLRCYVNSYCSWGILVLPSSSRYEMAGEVHNLLQKLGKTFLGKDMEIFIDEGIISMNEATAIAQKLSIKELTVCDSKNVRGIQLADLVAALCGVRLRQKLSGKPKILVYGAESGFDPPIEADLGYELWSSLRYSMRKSTQAKGQDMPEMACFDTREFGLFFANNCPKELIQPAESLFGEVYLGCIH